MSITACSGRAELTPSGKGLPGASVRFPSRTEPGSVHTATLTVDNPGPGDIATLAVSFGRVGGPAAQGLPNPLVDPGRTPDSGSIVAVRPAPTGAAPDVVYRFGPLSEEGTTTIEFEVRVPRAPGFAASSVTVYDDVEPTRARGLPLETTVEG
ncbi:MAG: hypothetical protein ABR529_09360 [Actinomycetota bacterium]